MALLFNDRNIAAGGQVYDRTNGTWVGETRGSVGDGIDHGFSGYPSRVIHDANGVVGVQVYAPTSRGGSGSGSAGVNPGNGGSGSASPQVTNGVPGRGGAGGRGAGSSLVVSGTGGQLIRGTPQRGKDQGTLFADDDGPFLDVWELAPATPMMIGGRPVVHDRGWSDAGQAEERWGEGELLSPTWLYQWGVAGADFLANIAAGARAYRDEHGISHEPHGGDGFQSIVDAFGRQASRRDGVFNGAPTVFTTGGGF